MGPTGGIAPVGPLEASGVGTGKAVFSLLRKDGRLVKVSVVIAARDEEADIGLCLHSLLAQEDVGEIIVVDDQSADRTAEIVQAITARHESVHLITAPDLPPCWTGKTHALHLGAAIAQGEYLLFTDADVIFSGTIISETVRRMDNEHLDFVGGLFGIRCKSLGEKICAPVLAAMGRLAMCMTAPRLGAGTGAFNMVRRSVYVAAGSHATIRSEIVDDVALARLMKSRGAASAFVPNTCRNVQVRLFKGVAGYWRAICRSALPFLGNRRGLVIGMALVCLCLAASTMAFPLLAIQGFMTLLASGGTSDMAVPTTCLAGYLVGAIAVARGSQGCSGSRLWIAGYPIAFTIMVLAVLVTAVRHGNGCRVSWRGRSYCAK